MKKWFMYLAALMLAFGLCAVPTGCGPGAPEEIKQDDLLEEPAGHEEEYEKIKKEQEAKDAAARQGG